MAIPRLYGGIIKKIIEHIRLAVSRLSSDVCRFSSSITVVVEVTPNKKSAIEIIANAIDGTVKKS